MFFNSKQKKHEKAAKCTAYLGAAVGQGQQVGNLGLVRMVECTPEQEAFRKNVESEVERRLAYKKALDDHAALPTYKMTSSYDLTKNVDTYYIQIKELNHGWSGVSSYYRTIYDSVDKAGTEARFNRLLRDEKQLKKSA